MPYFINKEDRIISAVKRRAVKIRKNDKFELEIQKPNDVRRALKIDEETGTSHWRGALIKETRTVLPAFKILKKDEKVPPIDLLTVFDIKMDLASQKKSADMHERGSN